MELDELQHALGGVVLEAAYLERVLRVAFSALVGSKYTAAVDGRMMAHALIEDCYHLTKVHAEIAESQKTVLVEALNACDAVNKKRNRVIHHAWAYRLRQAAAAQVQDGHDGPDGEPGTGRAADQLHQLAGQIADAAGNLAAAVAAALGPESMRIEDQLQLELGYENDESGLR